MTRIAIDTARQLQKVFPPYSATYRMLELGWSLASDLLREDELNLYNFQDRELFGDRPESFEDYIGEAIMDQFLDPEQERATYSEEVVNQYKDC